jgi:hypothetical protein
MIRSESVKQLARELCELATAKATARALTSDEVALAVQHLDFCWRMGRGEAAVSLSLVEAVRKRLDTEDLDADDLDA